jgi:hypothetical protein
MPSSFLGLHLVFESRLFTSFLILSRDNLICQRGEICPLFSRPARGAEVVLSSGGVTGDFRSHPLQELLDLRRGVVATTINLHVVTKILVVWPLTP